MGLIAYDPYADVGLAVFGCVLVVAVACLLAWLGWLDYRKRKP